MTSQVTQQFVVVDAATVDESQVLGRIALFDAAGNPIELGAGGEVSVAWVDVSGKPSTFPPTIGTTATTAKAGNAVQTATETTATAVAPGTSTNVQGILAELSARITALENA